MSNPLVKERDGREGERVMLATTRDGGWHMSDQRTSAAGQPATRYPSLGPAARGTKRERNNKVIKGPKGKIRVRA